MRCAKRLLLAAVMLAASAPATGADGDCDWPHWQQFRQHYLSEDGRVIDQGSERAVTVSEGQAYALFFALVANDRLIFDRLLRWTEDNLAQGDLANRLPAWRWGRRDDGSWGVLDENPASDADLWIAYTLSQAGHLWNARRYRVLARLVGRNILQRETADLPGLGRTLLPGPTGFRVDGSRWRLNPSYAPPQLLHGLAAFQPEDGWRELQPSNLRLLLDSAPLGFAPDWAMYDAQTRRFVTADAEHRRGSYDAIRVYLWLGMLDARAPERARLLAHYAAMTQLTAAAGAPPETVDVIDGTSRNAGPAGFSAALLPALRAVGRTEALAAQRKRLALADVPAQNTRYYDNVLTLFGKGWDEGRYRFAAGGALETRWTRPRCEALP
jgi:endoglucanase